MVYRWYTPKKCPVNARLGFPITYLHGIGWLLQHIIQQLISGNFEFGVCNLAHHDRLFANQLSTASENTWIFILQTTPNLQFCDSANEHFNRMVCFACIFNIRSACQPVGFFVVTKLDIALRSRRWPWHQLSTHQLPRVAYSAAIICAAQTRIKKSNGE